MMHELLKRFRKLSLADKVNAIAMGIGNHIAQLDNNESFDENFDTVFEEFPIELRRAFNTHMEGRETFWKGDAPKKIQTCKIHVYNIARKQFNVILANRLAKLEAELKPNLETF